MVTVGGSGVWGPWLLRVMAELLSRVTLPPSELLVAVSFTIFFRPATSSVPNNQNCAFCQNFQAQQVSLWVGRLSFLVRDPRCFPRKVAWEMFLRRRVLRMSCLAYLAPGV